MKCPFCKEEIENYTKECTICGEKIPFVYNLIVKIKNSKKVIIISALSLFILIVLVALCSNYHQYVNDPTYKSIQVCNKTDRYNYPTSAYNIMQDVIKQNAEIYLLLTSKEPQKKKENVFKTYLENITFLSEVLSYKITEGDTKGISFDKDINITSPYLPMYYTDWWEENAELTVKVNTEYLESMYSQYVRQTLNEYLEKYKEKE